jgi:hypothetical protein
MNKTILMLYQDYFSGFNIVCQKIKYEEWYRITTERGFSGYDYILQ